MLRQDCFASAAASSESVTVTDGRVQGMRFAGEVSVATWSTVRQSRCHEADIGGAQRHDLPLFRDEFHQESAAQVG